MKKLSNISLFQKTLFFALGMLVAAFVVSQEVLDYHCSMLTAQTQNQEQSDDDDDSETEIGMLTCDVVLPGSTLTLEPFSPVFIREIMLKEQVEMPVPQDISLDNTAHFKTLFRQIISTNAP
jgi:hypothetical protein